MKNVLINSIILIISFLFFRSLVMVKFLFNFSFVSILSLTAVVANPPSVDKQSLPAKKRYLDAVLPDRKEEFVNGTKKPVPTILSEKSQDSFLPTAEDQRQNPTQQILIEESNMIFEVLSSKTRQEEPEESEQKMSSDLNHKSEDQSNIDLKSLTLKTLLSVIEEAGLKLKDNVTTSSQMIYLLNEQNRTSAYTLEQRIKMAVAYFKTPNDTLIKIADQLISDNVFSEDQKQNISARLSQIRNGRVPWANELKEVLLIENPEVPFKKRTREEAFVQRKVASGITSPNHTRNSDTYYDGLSAGIESGSKRQKTTNENLFETFSLIPEVFLPKNTQGDISENLFEAIPVAQEVFLPTNMMEDTNENLFGTFPVIPKVFLPTNTLKEPPQEQHPSISEDLLTLAKETIRSELLKFNLVSKDNIDKIAIPDIFIGLLNKNIKFGTYTVEHRIKIGCMTFCHPKESGKSLSRRLMMDPSFSMKDEKSIIFSINDLKKTHKMSSRITVWARELFNFLSDIRERGPISSSTSPALEEENKNAQETSLTQQVSSSLTAHKELRENADLLLFFSENLGMDK